LDLSQLRLVTLRISFLRSVRLLQQFFRAVKAQLPHELSNAHTDVMFEEMSEA